ncbi:Elongator complex protein [Coemansia sp. Benny D115]|nr:Elongator complex protein [Coemansia sp. Benny D115]
MDPKNNNALDNKLPGKYHQSDFIKLQTEIEQCLGSTGDVSGRLIVIDTLDRLLRSSRTLTLMLLRQLRRLVTKDVTSRLLVRFSRDEFDTHSTYSDGTTAAAAAAAYVTNMLSELADALIDVHPLDDLKTWMPGWYSDGKTRPFLSLRDNDFRAGLVRLESKRQSGKVGFEVASFEIGANRLPLFAPIDVSAGVQLPQHTAEPKTSTLARKAHPESAAKDAAAKTGADSQKRDTSAVSAGAQQQQQQQQQQSPSSLDPTANLSFNLSLTDRQRRDKANVVLPYLDAQMAVDASAASSGIASSAPVATTGAEILYQLDEEDDWDEDDPDDDLEI